MFMAIYFTWAMMTTMSSRVYLNLVLAAHSREEDSLTTGALSSFHTGRANHTEGTNRGLGQIVTFGGKPLHRHVPLTTFTTVSLYLSPFHPLLVSPITAHRYSLSRRF
jgi:hypothetical protein